MNQELFNEITEWQKKTFPAATDLSKLHHLKLEVNELLDSIALEFKPQLIESEFADCFILLLGAADSYGLSLDGINEIIKAKMTINRQRKWGVADENGVVKHLK